MTPDPNPLLRTADVARLFNVDARTVGGWARRGLIPTVRTPGGHRRFPRDVIYALLEHVGADDA